MNIRIRRILCPVDFSDNSDHAMSYAVALARTFGAELRLVHVIAPIVAALPGETALPEVILASMDDLADATRARLQQTADTLAADGLTVRHEVLRGAPFIEIVRYAHEIEADLIVLGTRGRTGLGHLLIGSVAERVVRKAPCPVLTVKHPEHEFVLP